MYDTNGINRLFCQQSQISPDGQEKVGLDRLEYGASLETQSGESI